MLKEYTMRKHRVLRRHLPETHWYSGKRLHEMVRQYPSVFVKPDKGSQGKGIVRVRRQSRHRYQVSWGLKHKEVRRSSLLTELKKVLQSRHRYLVQQGLNLARYRKRLFDIRVYMQKPRSHWYVSGKVVRVGAAGRFVTNYYQGARPESVEKVLGSLFLMTNQKWKKTTRKKINSISKILAKVLDGKFPGIRHLGIDIGIDDDGRIWIIEANTNPANQTFKRLKDKKMYRKIKDRRRYILKKYK